MYLLEAQSLKKSFGDFTVFENLDFNVDTSEMICLLGLSGSGKTTLLSILSGLREPDEGFVRIAGIDMYGDNDYERSTLVGMIFQDFLLLEDYSAIENIIIASWHIHQNVNEIIEYILPILDKVGITEHINKYPDQLSSGLKQRVALARALANNAKIIFADEPTASLDSENKINLMDTLVSVLDSDRSVIFTTHDMEMAKYADKIYILKNGKLILLDKKIIETTSRLIDLYE